MPHQQTVLEAFDEWWCNKPHEETELQNLAFDYERKYFSDLRLIAPAIRKRVRTFQFQTVDGKWHDVVQNLHITIDGWIFRLRRMRNHEGRCDPKKQTISIKQGISDTVFRSALLHEMIHAYEAQIPPSFREWLLLDMYRRMTKSLNLKQLNRYIDISSHTMVHEAAHGVLFLLKSLDLDRRFHWPLGTVFGYGRTDYFENKKPH